MASRRRLNRSLAGEYTPVVGASYLIQLGIEIVDSVRRLARRHFEGDLRAASVGKRAEIGSQAKARLLGQDPFRELAKDDA